MSNVARGSPGGLLVLDMPDSGRRAGNGPRVADLGTRREKARGYKRISSSCFCRQKWSWQSNSHQDHLHKKATRVTARISCACNDRRMAYAGGYGEGKAVEQRGETRGSTSTVHRNALPPWQGGFCSVFNFGLQCKGNAAAAPKPRSFQTALCETQAMLCHA